MLLTHKTFSRLNERYSDRKLAVVFAKMVKISIFFDKKLKAFNGIVSIKLKAICM